MITINEFEPSYSLFPNNEYNMTLSDTIINMVNKECKANISWTFNSTDEVFKLGMLLSALETTGVKEVKITVGYLPYSRMDRHNDTVVNPFSLRVLIDMLPIYREHENGLTIYEFNSVHNEKVTRELLDERFGNKPTVSYTINTPLEITELSRLAQGANLIHKLIVFPDKGSIERYKKYLHFEDKWVSTLDGSRLNYVYGEKVRNFKTHKIEGYQLVEPTGGPFGNHFENDDYHYYEDAVIIDDVVSYGGTFIKIIDILEEQGINNVELITGNVEDAIYRGDLLEKETLKKVTTFNGLTIRKSYGKLSVLNYLGEKNE